MTLKKQIVRFEDRSVLMIKKKQITDADLIQMILEGNQAMNKATEYILNTYGEKIKGYILKQSGSIEEAEDALYEGISAFIMNVRQENFSGDSTISSYITSICKNIWFKKFKRMMVHKKYEAYELEKPQNKYEENVLTNDLKQGLDILMSTLKDKCKKVLKLWAMSYSMTEIADQLDMSSTQVVMNKKNLCIKELRQQLVNKPQLAKLII